MTRFFLLLALLLFPVPAVFGGALAGRKPNIIFILTDDQGYGDLSCHGNPVLRTPNLDRLHREGARFTDFQISPTCAPCRAALLTGRHEFRNGITHTIHERERLTLDAVTLAEILRSAGYTTGIFGKWHLGDEPDRWPDKRGFDEMFIHGAGGIGQSYPGSCGDAPGNKYFDPVILHNGKFEKTSGYCTDVFFSQALKWIEQVKGKKPFYAQIATNAPHAPLDVRPEDAARYAGKVPEMTAKFFGMIANIDDNTGRLLAKLAEWDLERETLVIFMNDNGGTVGAKLFNAGMRGEKVTPWQGGIRGASFWRWPGTIRPADVGALAANIDFLPTLAEIAGAPLEGKVKTQVEGRSLVPLLENPATPWADRILVTHVGRWERGKAADSKYDSCAIRDSRWKLVSDDREGRKAWQLFDLKVDPGEQRDLATSHPEIVRRLDGEYDAWWTGVQPCLVNEDVPIPAENAFRTLYRKQFGEK